MKAQHLKRAALVLALLAFGWLALMFFLDDPSSRRTRTSVSVADDAAIWASSAPDEGVSAWPEDAPRTLVGVVEDDSGAPIAGAMLLAEAQGVRRRGRTDHAGAFVLRRVPGDASLAISASGFEPLDVEDLALPRQARVVRDFVLSASPGIHGIVLGGEAPAAGALVALRPVGSRRHLGGGRTDSAGRFDLALPDDFEGPMELVAMHGQHGKGSVEVDGPGEYVVRLPGGGFVAGEVRDGSGGVVTAFSITASPLLGGSGPAAQSFDDAGGRFTLGPVAAGEVRVWAAADGYQPAELKGVVIEPGETTEVSLVLHESTVLEGRVTDASSGQPVVGAEVTPAEWRARALAQAVGAYTNEQGEYRLAALPGVRTSVEVKAEGYHSVLLGGVEGAPGERIVRDFSLRPVAEGERPGSELTGIGAVLRTHRDGVRIGQVVADSPAAEVLSAGDVVVSVDGDSVKSLGMSKVANAIRGEVGSEVVLMVRRGGRGAAERVVITRARVNMPRYRRRRRAPHGPSPH